MERNPEEDELVQLCGGAEDQNTEPNVDNPVDTDRDLYSPPSSRSG
mgnify:CR=1 FL=1